MAEGAVIRFGEVTNVVDEYGGSRIQARTPYDNPKSEKDLPYYAPLLPKTFVTTPKVGEMVLLFSMTPGEYDHCGFYLGPVISQEDKLFFERKDKAMALTQVGDYTFGPNPRYDKNTPDTLYPALGDVAIEGRKDTGIQLKDEEVRIKAGVKVVGDSGPKINTTHPAFISLKYYPKNDLDREGFKSTATIVADKINLIAPPDSTDDSATKGIPVTMNTEFNTKEKDNLISDSAMRQLVNKAHRLPYGDTLIEFLSLFRNALATHVHPFPTMAPCKDENMKAVGDYPLEGILSNTVRIN